jgi:hypothetical protein
VVARTQIHGEKHCDFAQWRGQLNRHFGFQIKPSVTPLFLFVLVLNRYRNVSFPTFAHAALRMDGGKVKKGAKMDETTRQKMRDR